MQTPDMTLLPQPKQTPQIEQDLPSQLRAVHSIARHIHRRLPVNVDFDDLFSAGLVGLVEAAANFNPAKNSRFANYAQFRIRGAILDSLRDADWAPRQLRRKGRAVRRTVQALASRFGREPFEDEVADELKISLGAYQKLLGELNGLQIGSLHRIYDEDSGEEELDYIPGRPEDDSLLHCIQGEMKDRLTGAIENLSERERLVITCYYFDEMTMPEIGLLLGESWTRVRQIHASAVRQLRFELSGSPSCRHRKVGRIRPRLYKTTEDVLLSKSAA